MDLYDNLSNDISKLLTTRYSSSFSVSSLFFSRPIRQHIYSIYGLVRVADEIVDTYTGSDKLGLLNDLEDETYAAIRRGYSANPVVHSYVNTARHYSIDKSLIAPFFQSMRTDANPPSSFSQQQYEQYIVGSAEVVGLMCLKVFAAGDESLYRRLGHGVARFRGNPRYHSGPKGWHIVGG